MGAVELRRLASCAHKDFRSASIKPTTPHTRLDWLLAPGTPGTSDSSMQSEEMEQEGAPREADLYVDAW
ncbi:hypothetical protein NUW54_g8373 [Trametes sanguinea]|uniref:Uncharacterized protein n=1 Tax=Trametes sanguinea TaxID=158606 RepID=A0ACC1PFJ5_9APHY|nr:hypothetical protein NUW54_g8373 [Trametes sanguinea]